MKEKTEVERYARLHAAYESVRALAPELRQRRLEESCADDPELLVEVLALLDVESGGRDSLDLLRPAELAQGRLALEALASPGAPVQASEWTPDRIGRYRVLGKLGEGGMGVVYEAEQDSPRRRVALKLIHPSMASGERLQRFRQESELLGRLHHPGIARIFEAGVLETARGVQPFFAMELVRGLDVASFAAAERLDTRARLGLIARIADAVQHAHERGVVHRDLKPDNVLVRPDGQPVVLDFGVARATDSTTLLSTLETQTGQILGTLAYMAPEQLGADPTAVAQPTDVYALGAIAHELLTGQLPHPVAGLPLAAAVRRIGEVDVPRIGRLDPRYRGDVETIVGKALEREPGRRYASPEALAADLRRWLAHEPIVARAPSKRYLAAKFARRHRGLTAGIAALALGLVAATGFAFVAEVQRDRAERLGEANDAARLTTLANLYRAQMLLACDAADGDGEIDALRELVAPWSETDEMGAAGWELDYLKSVAARRERVIEAAPMPLSLDWHPGGRWLAVGDYTKAVLVDVETETLLEARTIGLEDVDNAEHVAWSPDGTRLGVAGRSGLAVYDFESGGAGMTRPRFERLWHAPVQDQALTVAWSPDGTRVAASTGGRRVELYAAAGGRRLAVNAAGLCPTSSGVLAFSPAGDRLLVADHGKNCRLLDARTLEFIDEFEPSAEWASHITQLAIAPDGRRVGAATWDGELLEWDMASGDLLRVRAAHPQGAPAIAASPSGDRWATAGNDQKVRVWSSARTAAPILLRGHAGRVRAVAWSPSGDRLASCSPEDQSVRLWSLGTDAPAKRWLADLRQPPDLTFGGLGWHPDARHLHTRLLDRQETLRFEGGVLEAVDDPFGAPIPTAWNADATRRATAEGRVLRVHDEATGRQVPFDLSTDYVYGARWSPTDPNLLAFAATGGFWLLDLGSAAPPRHLVETYSAASVDWSPDGRWILARVDLKPFLISPDGERRELPDSVVWNNNGFSAFSADGRRLALCPSRTRELTVVDLDSMAIAYRTDGLRHDVRSLAWSPDGSRLAVGTTGGRVELCETAAGHITASLRADGVVDEVTWSPDGRHLLALTARGTLHSWSALAEPGSSAIEAAEAQH